MEYDAKQASIPLSDVENNVSMREAYEAGYEKAKKEYEKDKIDVEVCSECHPFYTGAQGRAKKTGKIEKFNRKYGLNTEDKKN